MSQNARRRLLANAVAYSALMFVSIACTGKQPAEKSDSKPSEKPQVTRHKTPFGISVTVPADWEVRESGAVFVSPAEDDDDVFRENLGIARKTVSDKTLKSFATKYYGSTKGDPDMQRDSIKKANVLGKEAQFSVMKRASKKRSYAQWLLMEEPGKFLVFTATIDDASYKKFLPIFRRIVDSAKAE